MTQKFGPSLGTKSNVTGTGASITLLAANPRRKGAQFFNDSGGVVAIDETGGTASATSCSIELLDQQVGKLHTMNDGQVYTGAVTALWPSGVVRVTEWE